MKNPSFALREPSFVRSKTYPGLPIVGFADIYTDVKASLWAFTYPVNPQHGNWLVNPDVLEEGARSTSVKIILKMSHDESWVDAEKDERMLHRSVCERLMKGPIYPGSNGRPPYVKLIKHLGQIRSI